jgi:hypothetical protein
MDSKTSQDFAEVDRQVIVDLLDRGVIDSSVLVRVAQLMMLPEFQPFFAALCEVGLSESASAADALRASAAALRRPSLGGLAEVDGLSRSA